MELAEQLATDYLNGLGLVARRFTKEEMRAGKTPDFQLFRNADLVAYCEAKHIQYDDWLDKQLKEARPLEIVGGSRPDPVFNRLTSHIHQAAQQFAAVNPGRKLPNVLVLANSDKHCTFHGDLIGVLTGNFYAKGGAVEPIFEQYSSGRIRLEKQTIDLYVWRDCWTGAGQRPRLWFWENSPHYLRVCTLVGSDTAQHRKVS